MSKSRQYWLASWLAGLSEHKYFLGVLVQEKTMETPTMGISNLVFILILIPLLSPAMAKPYSLAKPGCAQSCGNLPIPFPFGIGTGCFLDEWYEVECRNDNSSSSKSFLKKINSEVMKISLPEIYGPFGPGIDGTIQVRIPVFSNERCAGHGGDLTSSLKGSNFIFSPMKNTFIAVGCDVLAWMNTSTAQVSGCQTGCGGRNVSGGDICPVGSSCCQSTLPFNLQDFRVEFNQSSGKECAYAFLADHSWVALNTTSLYSLGTGDQSVPVLLEWGISNQTHIYPLLKNPKNHQYCGTESMLSAYRTRPFSQCHCWFGYEGNGYLENACSDVNECVEAPSGAPVCPSNRRCVNTQGGHRCVDRRIVPIGVGSAFGGLSLVLCIWGVYKFIKRRKVVMIKKKYFERNGGLLLQQQMKSWKGGSLEGSKIFSSKELEVATDNFNPSRVLGRGGQGAVYKGMLADGRIVAIKKSMAVNDGRLELFINEVAILSQINHRNIVRLLGCCLETQVPLLVYEFVPNGTLLEFLQDPSEWIPVTWETRLRISVEISGALAYLHSAASIPIYHRDIKSTNILLDDKYRAKVADFGTSKSVSLEQTHVTTMVRGTFGYLDPEYFRSSQFTDKSDVYSFGVVLVELLTGEKAISSTRENEGKSLAAYFIISMEQNQLFDILHPQVKEQGGEEEISRVAHLAKRCLHLHGRDRPTMKEVAAELEEIRNMKFPSAILGAEGNDGITNEQHADCLVPGGSNPDRMTLTPPDELPLMVTTSW